MHLKEILVIRETKRENSSQKKENYEKCGRKRVLYIYMRDRKVNDVIIKIITTFFTLLYFSHTSWFINLFFLVVVGMVEIGVFMAIITEKQKQKYIFYNQEE